MINGTEIDKAAAPVQLKKRDRRPLWDVSPDPTSLPGTLNSLSSLVTEADEVQQVTTLCASVVGSISKKSVNVDAMWNTPRRHGMRLIKDAKSLYEVCSEVEKAEEDILDRLRDSVQLFLIRRHFSEDEIEEYLSQGAIPNIVLRTYNLYRRLLCAIRTLAYRHSDIPWEVSPAHGMWKYHSQKMWTYRRNALTKKALTLNMYTFLRDSASKNFGQNPMDVGIWEQVSTLAASMQNMIEPANSQGSPRCNHCRNRKFHELAANNQHTKSACPVLDLTPKVARKVATKAVELHASSPSTAGIQGNIAAAKAAQGDE